MTADEVAEVQQVLDDFRRFVALDDVTAPAVAVESAPAAAVESVSVAVTFALSTSVTTISVRLSGVSSV